MSYLNYDPIYALCTVYGVSSIAIFRISGEGCVKILNKILNKKIIVSNKKEIFYRSLTFENKKIDDCLISVFPQGHGYTKEECAEISIHGSTNIIDTLDSVFEKIGLRKALRGEFTFRAFRNGELTLSEAESVLSLINSKNDEERIKSLENIEGTLDKVFRQIYDKLISLNAIFELQLDYSDDEFDEDISYPEKEISDLKEKISKLITSYSVSKKKNDGYNIVLLGKTNEGKSSLFNLLLKESRSIVSSQKGTTRDFIKEEIFIAGQKAFLIDTAGLNEESENLEKEGIKKSLQSAENADIIIYFISNDKVYDSCIERFESDGKKIIYVRSKSDVRKNDNDENAKYTKFISFSSLTGDGVDKLVKAISNQIRKLSKTDKQEYLLSSVRQENILIKVLNYLNKLNNKMDIELCSMLLNDSINAMSELVLHSKDDIKESVLDEIFSKFCVGK